MLRRILRPPRRLLAQSPRLSTPRVPSSPAATWRSSGHPQLSRYTNTSRAFASGPTRTCWSCHAPVGPTPFLVCHACRAVQPVDPSVDYFQMLGLERKYEVEEGAYLQGKYKDWQKWLLSNFVHSKSEKEKEFAVEQFALVTEAYRTLINPRSRAIYILKLEGVHVSEKEIYTNSLQPDVSMIEKDIRDTTEVSSNASVPEGSSSCTEVVLPDEVSTANIGVPNVSVPEGSSGCTEFVLPDEVSTASISMSNVSVPESSRGFTEFVLPDEVSTASISVSHVPCIRGYQRVVLLHRDAPLQLCCPQLKVRLGLSSKFVDYAGRPRLSFVVNAPPSLCKVLDACDESAQKLFAESGRSSDWRLVVSRKDGFADYPTIRVNISTTINRDVVQCGTEFYQDEPSGSMQKLVFSKFDVAELDSLIVPGTFMDVYLSLDPYDYKQSAGIKLVAKKIVIHK